MPRRYNPYVVYKGILSVKLNSLTFLETRKGKLKLPLDKFRKEIEKGSIKIIKNSESGKSALIEYESLRYCLKQDLILKFGLPPKVIN